MRRTVPTRSGAHPEGPAAAARWGVLAVLVVAFLVGWWFRVADDDSDAFGSNVVDTLRWFAGR
jgi:hypothetical protein